MTYCEHCRLLMPADTSLCPHCHRALRAPQDGDLCVLTEQNGLGTDILEQMLQEAGVPFLRRPTSGIAPLMGAAGTRWQFLSPYGQLTAAQAVLEDFLAPNEAETPES